MCARQRLLPSTPSHSRVRPEQHIAQTLVVDHDRVATDDGVAALALLRVRVEAPVARAELLHGARQYTGTFCRDNNIRVSLIAGHARDRSRRLRRRRRARPGCPTSRARARDILDHAVDVVVGVRRLVVEQRHARARRLRRRRRSRSRCCRGPSRGGSAYSSGVYCASWMSRSTPRTNSISRRSPP